jgi:SAM-dependent methyltransferase
LRLFSQLGIPGELHLMSQSPKGMLAQLASFRPGDSTRAHYDAWADEYERDLVEKYGYSAHVIGAKAFAEANADRGQSVIDVGCGTGLVGVELRRHGFTLVDGLDISQEMMAKALDKKVYRRLIAGDVMAGTGIDGGAYDAAICVGSCAPGHLGPAALREIARMVKSGGSIVIFMNAAPFRDEDYASYIDRLVDEGVWTVEAIETMNYMAELDRPGKLIRARRS